MKSHFRIMPIGCLLILIGAGCSCHRVLSHTGIPAKRFIVGGGFEIEYVAPKDGTAYYVEETSGKLLETKSLSEGDKARFSPSFSPKDTEEVLGIPIKDMVFTLYFVPTAALSGL